MATSDFTPTTAEVAVHMRARLLNEHGAVFPDFTADTAPPKAQIEALIPQGVGRLVTAIGATICPGDHQEALYVSAKALAALYVATLAERTYFPEQVGSQRSPYSVMYEEFKDGLKVLVESVSEHCGGGGSEPGESVGGAGTLPASSFPCPKGYDQEEW
jgi:hypothetical protein